MTEFKVGDKVRAYGVDGEVVIAAEHIFVQMTDGNSDIFLKDGKAKSWHKEPSLVLVERPQKKG